MKNPHQIGGDSVLKDIGTSFQYVVQILGRPGSYHTEGKSEILAAMGILVGYVYLGISLEAKRGKKFVIGPQIRI